MQKVCQIIGDHMYLKINNLDISKLIKTLNKFNFLDFYSNFWISLSLQLSFLFLSDLS